MQYTSARELRRLIETSASRLTAAAEDTDGGALKTPDPEIVERWVQLRIAAAAADGYLMTDRQYADYRTGRVFEVGDYARYVGVTRNEPIGQQTVSRPHGQIGKIVDVHQVKDQELVVTFRPRPAPEDSDETLVELIVRQGTRGYLDLERLEPHEAVG